MSSFTASTGAFFDELGNILDEQRSDKEESWQMRDGRPYSSMLTQDEEPTLSRPPNAVDVLEPEVTVRTNS